MSDIESNLTPYDLITDNLVEQALQDAIGPDAKVISWETKEFTNKGDNYSSIVTSISIKFREQGEIHETSFVAKLNPLRPASSLNDVMEAMYSREAIVLREIMEGMSSQLKKLGLPPIRTPKLYARNLEKGKEVFITENLRKQGFIMYDRNKGMDIKHALLVVEELGRFHASSLLYEETLSPKTITEAFDYFKEPWIDISHPSFSFFKTMMSAQSKGAYDFLMKAPATYHKCAKWVKDNTSVMAELFFKGYAPSGPMVTLNHGDCWTNNMLFKYDDEGNPVDIRFVDLQCCRRSSPSCDMNYFYYTSLNGVDRQKYMKIMEITYYSSFSKVMVLAGKEPPFTYPEFEEEMENRKEFGLTSGILVLPIVLAEGDEILDFNNVQDDKLDEFSNSQNSKFALLSERKSGPFKDRFLSMFDEMLKYKIFDD